MLNDPMNECSICIAYRLFVAFVRCDLPANVYVLHANMHIVKWRIVEHYCRNENEDPPSLIKRMLIFAESILRFITFSSLRTAVHLPRSLLTVLHMLRSHSFAPLMHEILKCTRTLFVQEINGRMSFKFFTKRFCFRFGSIVVPFGASFQRQHQQ